MSQARSRLEPHSRRRSRAHCPIGAERTCVIAGNWPCGFTDTESYFVSEASVYRLLKARDLIASPAFIVMKAANQFKDKTTAPNQLWQTDFTYLKGAVALTVPAVAFGAGKLWCRPTSRPALIFPACLPSWRCTLMPPPRRRSGSGICARAASTALALLSNALKATELLQHAITIGCSIEAMLATQRACRDDFRAGRIHCIDGWILAQTELDTVHNRIAVRQRGLELI